MILERCSGVLFANTVKTAVLIALTASYLVPSFCFSLFSLCDMVATEYDKSCAKTTHAVVLTVKVPLYLLHTDIFML